MTTQWRQRTAAAMGPAFVVLVMVGNSLSTSGATTEVRPSGSRILADFARQADNTTNRIGTMLEVLAFVCLMVFVAHVYDVLRRRSAFATAGAVALIGAVTMLAVKISSGAPFLAGVLEHDRLTPDSAIALNALNGAAFVISWLPYAVFVGGAAVALRSSGHIGRVLHGAGLLLGISGVLLAVIGALDLESANPVAFLLSLVWTLCIGVVLVARPDRHTLGSPAAAQVEPLGQHDLAPVGS